MYVDAVHDEKQGVVIVVERSHTGERVYKSYPVNYTFYYTDPHSTSGWKSIYGDPVTAMTFSSHDAYKKELHAMAKRKLWEVGVKPVHKILSEHYQNVDPPKLHIAYIDIETAFDNVKGFSTPEDPFNPITAITLYLSWTNQLVTLAVAPTSLSFSTASEICERFDNCIAFQQEKSMLNAFLDVIDDADVLTGWNSEEYDLPYLIGRCTKVLGKASTRRFCLWNKFPRKKSFEKFGVTRYKYETYGRVHLDYMDIYKKYTSHELQSYSLNFVAELELGDTKTDYEGTLDQLYHTNFHRFIEYNRQDVDLLRRLEEKLQYLELANIVAHSNTVLLPTVMGTVAITEQAIYNYAHDRKLVVPSRKERSYDENGDLLFDADGEEYLFDDSKAAGAFVAEPKKGLHDYVGAVDINSLYPSAFRALNMSPETLLGQVRLDTTNEYIQQKMKKEKCSFASAWEGLFGTLEYQAIMRQDKNFIVTIDWDTGWDTVTCSAFEAYELIFKSGQEWVLTANGTIFDNTKKGLIPTIFEEWYANRKKQQKMKKMYSSLVSGIDIPERLK